MPAARDPYDEVVKLGYGCSVFLAYNVRIHSNSSGASIGWYEKPNNSNAQFDLSLEVTEKDRTREVLVKSGIGP